MNCGTALEMVGNALDLAFAWGVLAGALVTLGAVALVWVCAKD